MIQLGSHKIQGVLHTWLPNHGMAVTHSEATCTPLLVRTRASQFWIHGPCFIAAKRGTPLDANEAALVLDAWSLAIGHVLDSYPGFLPVGSSSSSSNSSSNVSLHQPTSPMLGTSFTHAKEHATHGHHGADAHPLPSSNPCHDTTSTTTTTSTPAANNHQATPDIAWARLSVNPHLNLRLSVSLVRTAILNAQGGFLQDGFVLLADQRRHVSRRGAHASTLLPVTKRLCFQR
jgi:hypothetical protein